MTNVNNKGVYIPSIEAADIYSHMIRNSYVKEEYVGMIPYSLELIQLKKQGLVPFSTKFQPNKNLSNDIINVKFDQKVKSGKHILKFLPEIITEKESKLNEATDSKVIDKLKKSIEHSTKLQQEIDVDSDEWQEVSAKDLREILYVNGLVINGQKYHFYKRSSSKSRTGQCLFIKEELHNSMINWSRMDLPFNENDKVDLAGLLAYESLVGSSIESTIEINPKNILIVDDVKSTFKEVCNVIRTGENGFLDSYEEMVSVTNELFDGEALLDSGMFKQGQSMMLLRNHMFKAAAFATNLQLFFNDYFKSDYEEKYIEDMFGNQIKVTDIQMVINPSCLKALKFSSVLGSKHAMWEHWKMKVEEDGSLFGVCKHEKATKRGYFNGNPLQQTSYQMLNSLPADKEDIEKLSQFERDYIMELKNNDEAFIQYINDTKNEINSNEMFVELYSRNKEIVRTKIFREFRRKAISNYVKYVKKGKVRLNGDYAVLLGNPVEYLYHSVGEEITESLTLKGNQVYSTMFNFGRELVGFRNPHTSQSNVLKVENTYNKMIDKYFELTSNIVAVNTIGFNLPNILSGSDFDSDTIVLFDNVHMLKLANECYGYYKVCVNDVSSQSKSYKLNLKDIATIDNNLSDSQRFIGEVVNVGQLALSLYWDKLNNGLKASDKQMQELSKKTDVMCILGGICIDLAKKFYDIDIAKEIKNVRSQLDMKVNTDEESAKPDFWRYVSNNENTKFTRYKCPMDYLYEVMSELKNANGKTSIELVKLLDKKENKKANRRQIPKAQELAFELQGQIAAIKTAGGNEEEMNIKVEEVTNAYSEKFKKLKINDNTMFAILRIISEEAEEKEVNEKKKKKSLVRLMNALYKSQGEIFINAFTVK
ncbi:hypothetical protein GCM10009865_47440 [Aeromicrobium ponti]|uniref:RNA-dependent RNA polymerase n=1 Tax=Cytobacillus oceanisediminis TaxID=665099 RepID=A0A562JD43_9BACI|nr:hypothetical protein [Cytobacillus oceanisediminis]TWH81013.1 RNA-dependent RNA polymerase [Cytobacillus oceanisediminis]